MNFIKRFLNNEFIKKFLNRETISYFIFGVLTTVLNYVVYAVCIEASGGDDTDSVIVGASTFIAWLLAVIFAYITNKLYVFESKSFKLSVVLSELSGFVSARVFSGVVELIWMMAVVELFEMNSYAAKIIINVVVVIMNYFFSKFFIFKEQKKEATSVRTKLYENRYIFMSFFMAALIVTLAFAFLGYYPLGDNCMLRVDLYHQYGPFHEELRNRILNGESLFYSWEGGLGKEFIAQLAYYTASPISFLILLFSQDTMPEAMAAFVIIKVAFAGGFFAYYLKKAFNKNDLSIVAFAICYSSMAYITSYYWNVMWLDAVAVFPLVALGIEMLVKEDKHALYCLSLAFTIIVNFYIAFLVCIFATLYYIIFLFTNYTWKKDREIIIKRTIKFAIFSAIGGGISMFLTIPTAVALSRTNASDSTFPAFEVYTNIYQLITNHFMGARPVVLARNEDLPNVYSGLLTLLLIPAYFCNRAIPKREKILYGVFIGFMLLCSSLKTLDFLVHGLHFPSNLPHRYTFIYSFVLISMAFKAFINLKSVKLKHLYVSLWIFLGIVIYSEFIIAPLVNDVEVVLTGFNGLADAFSDKEKASATARLLTNIAVNIFMAGVYVYVIKECINARSIKKSLMPFLVFIVFCEGLFSTFTGFNYVGVNDREKYVKYMPSMEETIDFLNDRENDNFYRMEMRRFATINESALYHFKGYSQFSSLAYGAASTLMERLGMAATSNSYRFYDPTPLVDSMFNIKYIINKDNKLNSTEYEFVEQFDNTYVYENKYVLPLGFVVDNELENWDIENGSPFDVQNNFVKLSTGTKEDTFTEKAISDFNYDNIKITSTEEERFGKTYKYELTNPSDLTAIPEVNYKIKNEKEGHVYLYVDAGNAKRVKYTINGNKEDRELSAGKSLFDVGNLNAGDEIFVEFTLDRKGEYEKTYRKSGTVCVYAAAFNEEVFSKAQAELAREQLDITYYDDTNVNGNVTMDNDGILYTSIPYDSGWKITVDGEKAEATGIGADALLGVKLTKGTHEVKFHYEPVGFYLGCIISIISVVIYIVYDFFLRKKEKKNA